MIWLEKYKTWIIGGFVFILAVAYFVSRPGEEETAGNALPLQFDGQEDGNPRPGHVEEQPETSPYIYVDVKGAVKAPGLYQAEEGDRVLDAIQLAGGLSKKADENQINLALKLHDEMVIFVPAQGEAGEEAFFFPAEPSSGGSAGSGKININKAEQAELETLSGIGPAKAQAIIDYREQQGPFKSIEDLKNVSGIGEKTFEKLQDSIAVH